MTVSADSDGRLVDNILHFAHALRKAGVPVGTGQIQSSISAVAAAGFTSRLDFFYTLQATMVTRPEHLDPFRQIFKLFWRDPEFLEKMVKSALPLLQTMEQETPEPEPAQKRAAEALWDRANQDARPAPEKEVIEIDATLSWSKDELLQTQDFDQMSNAEMALAAEMIRQLRLPAPPILTRRMTRSHQRYRIDGPAMMRQSMKTGGEFHKLRFQARRTRPPDLVVLCDISGSMTNYARMMMQFVHAMRWAKRSGWGKTYGFTFGTRLTDISRALAISDIDQAMAALGQEAPDWKGGTRIGHALARFNRDWSRRILGRGAVVLLITDGLERGGTALLSREAARLQKSCHRLIWLNPLLRWDGFEPQAQGIKALLPNVDALHSCHSVRSLSDLGQALTSDNEKARMLRLL